MGVSTPLIGVPRDKGTEGTKGTRGPSPVLDTGPLVTGPLGPLVTPGSKAAPRIEHSERFRLRLLEAWGANESGGFPCPLPRHDGRAVLVDHHERPGELALGCCKSATHTRSLGEVRAVIAYGFDRPPHNPRTNIEIATWTRLLAWELGVFQPVDVSIGKPEGAPHLARAAQGFALLCGLRWADYERRPVAYAVRFMAAWCGLSMRQAGEAQRALRDQGLLREQGRVKRSLLFAPGPPHESGEVLTVPTVDEWGLR
jgi:hypothetical protein